MMSDNLTAMIETLPRSDISLWDAPWQYDALGVFALLFLIIGISIITFGLVRYFKRRRRNVQGI